MKITYKEIAELINQSEQNIKQLKNKQPEKLELYKLGALCKKYNIAEKDLESIVLLKENIRNN